MTGIHTETLRLVGGRRLEGAAPGVAVLTSPLHPARGREEETFLMVLDLGESTASRLYREIREAAAQAFWTTPGSVTAALRQAVGAANNFLFLHNQELAPEQHCYGALTCAALKPGELFLAQAGPSCACLLSGEKLERFPQEGLPPMGTSAYVEVQLAYVPVRSRDRLVLASEGLARAASDDAVRRVLALSEVDATLDGLEQVAAGEDFTALLVRWLKEEPAIAPSPPPRRRRRARPLPPEEAPAPVTPSPEERAIPEAPPPAPETVVGDPSGRLWEPVQVGEEELEIRPWEPAPEVVPPPRPPRRSLAQRLRLGDRLRRAGGWVGAAATAVGGGLRTVFRRALPGEEERARARPRRERRPPPAENPRLMASVAVAILVVVALVTLAVWVSHGSALRRDQALSRAQEYATQAQEATDPEEERSQWEAVQTTLAGMEGDPDATGLLAQAQVALNRLDKVIWLEPILLRDLGPGASVTRLVAHGQDIFLLDAGRQAAIQLTLTEAGELASDESPPTLIRAGEERGEQTVAALIDVDWSRPGGEWTTNALVVLDAENRLWVYDPAWATDPYPVFLGPAPGAGAPVAMAAFDGRLYLLDPQADQVWRYWPREGGYPDRAGPYFPTGAPDSLRSARDLAINGSVYVLLADEAVAKYYDGEPVPFEVTGVPAPSPRFVALAVDPNLTDGPVYLADAAGERLVILDGGGAFRAQLRSASGAFSDLQALTLDDAGGRLFFAAEGRLYEVSLPALP